MLKINEIYKSIQGESTYVGCPTVFVRTSGCPLRCSFCDSAFAFYEGTKMSIEHILKEVAELKASYVCITGGEPLAQKKIHDLMQILCHQGYHVSLETSGALSCQNVPSGVKKIVDVKTPDSGAKGTFLLDNLKYIDSKDEIKFVICSLDDVIWSADFIKQHQLLEKCVVLFSPSHGKMSAKWLAEKILDHNLKVRLQIQAHKYIWDAHTRRV